MMTQKTRLQKLESEKKAKVWTVFYRDFDSPELYHLKDKDGEVMTLDEAHERFENLIIVEYVEGWHPNMSGENKL